MIGKFPHQYDIYLKKADADLALVLHALALVDKQIDLDIILFHLQQSVEKYLKALICFNGFHFEKIHDIDKIISVCRSNSIELPEYVDVFVELNPYAVDGRYAVISDDMDDAERYAKLLSGLSDYVKNAIVSEHQ
jgi:HEPN domain-containing protein